MKKKAAAKTTKSVANAAKDVATNNKKTTPKRLVLLDTHALLHRAYHALPDFATSAGLPTGALYGLCSMIIKIIDEFKPDYVLACYDLPGKTYRHEAYDAYKAGRKQTDEALVSQIIKSRDIFNAFSIPMYEKEGFEADDMLGTLSKQAIDGNFFGPGPDADKKPLHLEVIIASGDMDTMQLIKGKKVQVYTLKKGIKDTILYDEQAVIDRFSFGPERIADYKGLRGDPSDNIVGIKGIGEKTATTLISQFGSIEEIYKKLKKDKESFKKVGKEAGLTDRIIGLIEDGEEEAIFSKMLATIRCDAPVKLELPEKPWLESLDFTKINNLFSELEFRTMGQRVKQLVSGKGASSGLVGTSASAGSGAGIGAGPLADMPAGTTHSSSHDNVTTNSLFSNYDPILVKKAGIALWILNSNKAEATAQEILEYTKKPTIEEALASLEGELKQPGLESLEKVYKNIELPLIPIVSAMEKTGVKLDIEKLKELSNEYHTRLSELEKNIHKLAGQEFNINSPKQMGEILFTKLALGGKNIKKTKGGAQSTRESELEKMKDEHPIIKDILEYRELAKLLSTYIDVLPTMLDSEHRLHTSFMQNGTTTGRMSSRDPNLQNIPIKTDRGREIRNAFVAGPHKVLASFDYSQLELRIAGILSGDPKLIQAFTSGDDVHASVASFVFKVPIDKVDKEMRRQAKVINFGILYGMGVSALKVNLGTDRKTAQEFYNNYFATFAGLAKFLDQVKFEVSKRGYTETFFGRRRYFDGMKSSIPYIRAMAERMAINAPIQGTNADMIKIAMKNIDDALVAEGLSQQVLPILQIHDELVYEIDEDKKVLDRAVSIIKKNMENVLSPEQVKKVIGHSGATTHGIPIIVNCNVGKSWGDQEAFGRNNKVEQQPGQ